MTAVKTLAIVAIASIVLIGGFVGREKRPAMEPRLILPGRWDPKTAAAYLDERQSWWESWPKSARDHGTVCVSCHTALPYALARPELGAMLHEREVPSPERRLVADVATRVRLWSDVKPFYGDTTSSGRTKAIQSRGTEAVLNALVLAARDHREGVVSSDARLAFTNMFALQDTSGDTAGAWAWLDFGLRPWESRTSVYFGAAVAAIAIGLEPHGYVESAEIQANVERLRRYLRSNIDQPLWSRLLLRDNPSLFNRAMLLWAGANLSGLISSSERRSIVSELCAAQGADGSWRLGSLGRWRPGMGVPADTGGDGYATGLIAYALEESGMSPNEPHLARALAWLTRHQEPTTGMWKATSLNKRRDTTTDVGKFMSDAATAFAVLALSTAQP
jgi:squalene-hopene/tetraprenyl-beta-curcumene cyclase